jgi:hypothetical protein
MLINVIGKFKQNPWGVEWFVKDALEKLEHQVNCFDINASYAIIRNIAVGSLTIVLQGYGLKPALIEGGRRITGKPWILWHAEVMSPLANPHDEVVLFKMSQLAPIAPSFDAIFHNCNCCLEGIRKLSKGRPVYWAPANGVAPELHRKRKEIAKRYPLGFYGYPSSRRTDIINYLRFHGVEIEWKKPEDGFYGEKLVEFINQCHCMLNLHYSDTLNTECRLYESLGCGVPVISEPISMPDLFYGIPKALMFAEGKHELLELWKSIEGKLSKLVDEGEKAMHWLHENASYVQRCDHLLKMINGLSRC